MKKYLYELTNEELEKYINTSEVQKLMNFVDNYKPCEELLSSYISCITMKVLLEQQIEVGNND